MVESDRTGFIEPLKITERQHAALLATVPQADARRRHERYAVPPTFRVLVRFISGGSTSARLRVSAADISAGGIGVWHSAFVAPGTRAEVNLLTLDREMLTLTGAVSHCRYVSGRAHLIGVKFDHAVDPACFVAEAAPPEPATAPAR